MQLPEPARELLRGKAWGHVITLNTSGTPQVTMVWVDEEDGDLVFNTNMARQKAVNLQRDPRVMVSVQNVAEPQQYLLLLALRGMPEGLEPNIATIAERLQLRHHSAVELVDRMEARGLVRRVRDTRDRRRVSVDVTPTGLEMLERLAHVHLEELTHLAPELCDALQPLLNHRLGPSVVNVKC